MIKKITTTAKELGACERATEATDWKSLAWLFFSPQGREFCATHNYPSIPMWSEIKRQHNTTQHGIYVDEGYITIRDNVNTAIIGQTEAKCIFSRPDTAHRVIVMHGATAHIKATDYAVVLVVKVGADCTVTIDKDDTATILW